MTAEQFSVIEKQLKEAHERVLSIKSVVTEHSMPSLFTTWTPKHLEGLGRISSFSRETLSEIDEQASAFAFGIKCRAELAKEKAEKTTTQRKKASSVDQPASAPKKPAKKKGAK